MAPYEESKRLKIAVSDVKAQLLLVRMFASARVVHHKTAGFRFWRNNQWRVLQPAVLIANRKKPRRSGQGVWRGVNEIFGMRAGWHTIPVKAVSQFLLSSDRQHATKSSMGRSVILSGTVFGFKFWTAELPVRGNSKCRPTA